MEIKQSSNTGRFAYTITTKVADGLDASVYNLVKEGLANLGFRAAASETTKALVKAGGDDVNGKAVSKDTRRVDFVYNAVNAGLVETTAQAKLDAICKEDVLPAMTFEVTGEYIPGESASPMVRATLFVDTLIKAGQEAKLRATLEMFDASASSCDRDGLIAIANGAGLGIQPPKQKKA